MKEAKLDPEVLKSVGEGMRKMAAQAKNINTLADASVAANEYTESIKGATESLNSVNESYNTISSTAKDLAESTTNVKDAVGLTENYKENLKSATESLGAIVAASGAITETASGMAGSPAEAQKLQKELQALIDNLNKLNKIYGGMYHAMHD
jgi:gliding motility-associated protein GldL